MTRPARTLLRVLVPVMLLAMGVGIGFLVFRQKPAAPAPATTPTTTPAQNPGSTSSPGATPPPATTPPIPSAAPASPQGGESGAPTAGAPAAPAPAAAPAATVARAAGSLRARAAADGGAAYQTLGSAAPDASNPFTMRLTFTDAGAGVSSLELARQFKRIGKNAPHEVLQQIESWVYAFTDSSGKQDSLTRSLVPFALLGVTIDGAFVPLSDVSRGRVWKETAPGAFEAVIEDEAGTPVARVVRTFRLAPGEFGFRIDQTLENLSGGAMRVTWHQLGPGDLPQTSVPLGGDMRRVRIGYLPAEASSPGGQLVLGGRHLIPHATAVGTPADMLALEWSPFTVWPQPEAAAEELKLSWVALANRYFAVGVYQPVTGPGSGKRPDGLPDKSLRSVASVDRVVLGRPDPAKSPTETAAIVLRLTGVETAVAAGGTMDASIGVYAGPITHATIDPVPEFRDAGLGGLVIYTYGGPCAFCTFQPITQFLRWFLGLLHGFVVFDWALAVMVLVVCVRTILHPVTRWSQTNLQRFGKQMAALAPKQAKIREKFADDPKRMREEIAKLMREENVNYAGALGCLPMFLQTPIWIALYAMISFTYELRHEPAFFGVFQAVTGGAWKFLGDLAEPDNFIPFGTPFHVPLLSSLIGPISGVHILPLMMGVLFYIQQKYMQPPTSTALTPEQQSQQKIMKVMLVVMFPLFMYNQPAALNLYFLVNSSLGILESRWIRKRLDEEDKVLAALGPRARPPAKPGFWARLQQQVAERQKLLEERRKQMERQQRRGRGK